MLNWYFFNFDNYCFNTTILNKQSSAIKILILLLISLLDSSCKPWMQNSKFSDVAYVWFK